MNIKEIFDKYKDGDSTVKLNIIGSFLTIITTVIALITGQLLTFKFVFEKATIIKIAYYIAGMGISLIIFCIYIKLNSFMKDAYNNHFFLRAGSFLLCTAALILIYYTIWSYILIRH